MHHFCLLWLGFLYFTKGSYGIPSTASHVISRDRAHYSPYLAGRSILIVYSGPTMAEPQTPKELIYESNFFHFLNHGLPCSHHCPAAGHFKATVVLSLTADTAARYGKIIRRHNATCGDIRIILRQNRCYDMESARTVLVGSAGGVSDLAAAHDIIIYLNCGLVGPFLPLDNSAPFWAARFAEKLAYRGGNVTRLVGITMNSGSDRHYAVHVQSMLWATDSEGLELLVRGYPHKSAIFNCSEENDPVTGAPFKAAIVSRYEHGMSKVIMEEGFKITSLQTPNVIGKENLTATKEYPNRFRCKDKWDDPYLQDKIDLVTALFWKTTRLRPGKKHVGYDKKVALHMEAMKSLLSEPSGLPKPPGEVCRSFMKRRRRGRGKEKGRTTGHPHLQRPLQRLYYYRDFRAEEGSSR